MDLAKILEEMREEHAKLGASILALERLAAGSAPRRGRPPKWMAAAKGAGPSAPLEGKGKQSPQTPAARSKKLK